MAVTIGGELRVRRRSRGWDVPELARRLRRAADEPVAAHEGLVRMIRAWERGDHRPSERYELLYRRLGLPSGNENGAEPQPTPTRRQEGTEPVRRRTFVELTGIGGQAGSPVRSQYAKPGAPRSLIPDAILVAPATYNTINKWAEGISDTYALGVLAETTGLGVPTVVLPFVNTALADRAPFRRSVDSLRAEGVKILLGPGGFQPHPPRTGEG
jgi:hypothetical protein